MKITITLLLRSQNSMQKWNIVLKIFSTLAKILKT